MKISYDPEVDAMGITFRETTVTSQRVAEGVALDFDSAGRLAGIEILDAVRRVGDNTTLRQVTLENVGLADPPEAKGSVTLPIIKLARTII